MAHPVFDESGPVVRIGVATVLFAGSGSRWQSQQIGVVESQCGVAEFGTLSAHGLPAHGFGTIAEESSVHPFEQSDRALTGVEDAGDELGVAFGLCRQPVLFLSGGLGDPDEVSEGHEIAFSDERRDGG